LPLNLLFNNFVIEGDEYLPDMSTVAVLHPRRRGGGKKRRGDTGRGEDNARLAI